MASNNHNTVLTRRITGDEVAGKLYRGESNKLLFQLRNAMDFQKLGQQKMTRYFMDGTVITAWSLFGHDFVDVDVTKRKVVTTEIEEVIPCSITLIDAPNSIPPMQNPGLIHPDEVSFFDYFKIYYTFECETCVEEVEFKYAVTAGTEEEQVSLEDVYEMEEIERGEDSDGKYFILKGYTEKSEFTRSGYVNFDLTFNAISSTDPTKIVCTITHPIEVDCCIKKDYPAPAIYWEYQEKPTDPWIEYKGKKIYRVDSPVDYDDFNDYLDNFGGTLYTVPQVGGCPKYKWGVSAGSVIPDQYGLEVVYEPPETPLCKNELTINSLDRCDQLSEIKVNACCDGAPALSIGYTSLAMKTSTTQTLTANGGCSPYTWALVSGGGSLSATMGASVVYTSPSTNPDCSLNATIRLTDCCGGSTTITISISKVTGQMGWQWDWPAPTTCYVHIPAAPTLVMVYKWWPRYRAFYCDGTVSSTWTDRWYLITLESTPPTSATDTRCTLGSTSNPNHCGVWSYYSWPGGGAPPSCGSVWGFYSGNIYRETFRPGDYYGYHGYHCNAYNMSIGCCPPQCN